MGWSRRERARGGFTPEEGWPRKPAAGTWISSIAVLGSEAGDLLLPKGRGARSAGRPTHGADRIEGRGGDDRIDAGRGDDLVMGDYPGVRDPIPGSRSGGADVLRGGAGDDVIWGEGDSALGYTACGDDRIDGGRGNDVLVGDAEYLDLPPNPDPLGPPYAPGGDDTIYGGPGDDAIYGDAKQVWAHAVAGDDLLDGGPGDDRIFGEAETLGYAGLGGDDRIFGGFGDDVLFGDARQIIETTAGNDELDGGPGNDVLYGDAEGMLFASPGDDVLDGGAGDDLLIGDGRFGPAVSERGGHDVLRGGAGNDVLFGDSPDGFDLGSWPPGEQFYSVGGRDLLDGGPGDDVLIGGAGDDILIGGPGRDRFVFAAVEAGGRWFGSGSDTIADFRSGEDVLDLSGWGLDGASLDSDANGVLDARDAAFTVLGGALLVDLGRAFGRTEPGLDTITLEGVQQLRVDDLVPLSPGT